jgi:hypothetical protein
MSTKTATQGRQNRLPDAIKTFLVQRLAMFETPSDVAASMKEEFGVEVTRQHVQKFDAKRNGKLPAKRWVALFDATRKRFLDEITDIPAANKSVRVRRLDRMATKAEAQKNYFLAAAILEQIAKEVGDAYVNRKRASGERDDPVHMTFFMPEVPPPVGRNNQRDDD